MIIGNSDYESDLTIWYQIVIDDSNDTIVISDQTLTSAQVTLDHGAYFVSSGDTGHADYSFLLDHIETKLDAAVSGGGGSHTYSFSLATPADSSDYTNGGVSLSTSDSSDFTLEFSDGDFSCHDGIFGYLFLGTGVGFDQSSTSGTYTGLYTQYGRWQAPPDHYPHDQRDAPKEIVSTSGGTSATEGRLYIARQLQRRMMWRALPAAVVHGQRALDATLAGQASLDTGDTNNGLKQVYRWQAYDMVLAQGAPSTNPDAFEADKREIVKFPTNTNFNDLPQDLSGKEQYDIEWLWEVVDRVDNTAYNSHLG